MTTPVSLTLPQFDRSPQAFLDLCRQAPTLGITGVFGFDHLIPLGDPHRPVFEGVAVLGAAAAVIPAPARVGSLVLRTSSRPPAVTAAAVATLAAIAETRVVVGLGAGDKFSADEAHRYGMARGTFQERLQGLQETIELIRQQTPAVTVWVGGLHQTLRQVAARLADGWNAWQVSREDLVAMTAQAREWATRPLTISWGGGVILAKNQESLAEALARRGGREEVTRAGLVAGTPAEVTAELRSRAEVVDELVLSVLPNVPSTWHVLATEVLPNLGR